ncbi:MAG: hypothetical protein JW874_06450 [Spirochaetales bacterium]|nr:hypothetical protein [Spirochaetales bacterium]
MNKQKENNYPPGPSEGTYNGKTLDTLIITPTGDYKEYEYDLRNRLVEVRKYNSRNRSEA